LHKITQNAGRRYVIGKDDRRKLRAFLLRHAELYAPAEQEPRDDPMLASNAGDRRSGCPLSIAIASFCSSLKKRRAGVIGACRASFEAAVKLLSAADWLALVPTTGRAEG
jgi:hypothetical protein